MQTNTTRSAPSYSLGMQHGGSTFLFTELGEFRSGLEARTKALSMLRNGVWFVYERRELSRFGVNFGSTLELVATV